MAGKTVGKRVFDWLRILSRVPAEARGDYLALRAKHESLQTQNTNLTEKPIMIDWTFYQSNVSNSALVAQFKNKYEQLKIPFPKDTESENIEQKSIQMEKDAIKLMEESKLRTEEYKTEIVQINNLKPIEDMTVDEYFADKPELERQIDWEWENYEIVELEEAKQSQ